MDQKTRLWISMRCHSHSCSVAFLLLFFVATLEACNIVQHSEKKMCLGNYSCWGRQSASVQSWAWELIPGEQVSILLLISHRLPRALGSSTASYKPGDYIIKTIWMWSPLPCYLKHSGFIGSVFIPHPPKSLSGHNKNKFVKADYICHMATVLQATFVFLPWKSLCTI